MIQKNTENKRVKNSIKQFSKYILLKSELSKWWYKFQNKIFTILNLNWYNIDFRKLDDRAKKFVTNIKDYGKAIHGNEILDE